MKRLDLINLLINNLNDQQKSMGSLHIMNIEFQSSELPNSNQIDESEQNQNLAIVKMPWKLDIIKSNNILTNQPVMMQKSQSISIPANKYDFKALQINSYVNVEPKSAKSNVKTTRNNMKKLKNNQYFGFTG